jgi:hypothetical protein
MYYFCTINQPIINEWLKTIVTQVNVVGLRT